MTSIYAVILPANSSPSTTIDSMSRYLSTVLSSSSLHCAGKSSSDVRGQAILGEEEFADRFVDHLRKHKAVPEITRSQKDLCRHALEKLFPEDIFRNKRKRDRTIAEAVGKHGYLQREIAAHLGLYYAAVSRLIAGQE